MLKNTYLRKTVSFALVFQMLLGTVFGYSEMKMGLAPTTSLSDNSTVRQKAYCTGTGYAIMIPDNADAHIVNMILGFQTGDTDVSASSWTYSAFARGGTDTRVPSPAIVVDNSISGYGQLPNGYFIQAGGRNTDTPTPNYYTNTFSLGYLRFTNSFGVTGTYFKYNIDSGDMTSDWSSRIAYTNLSPSYSYQLNYKFIPEPCVADQQEPLGSNYFPSNTISDHAAIDSGVLFRITDGQSSPVYSAYAYTGGNARENGIEDPLTTDYSATGAFQNQWGLNTGSVRIILTYTGVARGTMDQRGTGIAITKVFSGSDLVFDYLTGGDTLPVRTWNRNYLGAWVSVSGAVLDTMPDFRKETSASVRYTGADWANSLLAITSQSGTSRLGANLFQSSLYTFNAGVSNTPTSFLAKDAGGTDISTVTISNTRVGVAAQQINGTHSQFHFAFTDNRAGVASGSIKVTVYVYPASNTVQSSYQTSSSAWSYVYSGSDVSLFAVAGAADYPDYTGYVDINPERTLTTGDRVVVNVYAQDFVGNSISQTGSFDMQDYPAKPFNDTITVQVENHGAIISSRVITSPASTTLADYYTTYPSLSGFTYLGQVNAEFTGTNAGSNLTGVLLENGVLTGFAHIDTGLTATKTFSFPIIVHNIYGQTGTLTLEVTVEPGCSEGAGCGPRLMMYTGTSLAEAQANYPLTGTRYNNRFIKINSSDRPVLTGTADHAILYCAGSGGISSIDISNLEHPTIQNSPNPIETFSGSSTLYVSGDYSNGLSGVIYLNGNIYLFRDATGTATYDTGKYIGGLESNGINWTRNPVITGTIAIVGSYITGENLGIFSGPIILSGGALRIYTYVSSDITGFDILIENRWNDVSGGTVDARYYQTGIVNFNNSRIDLTAPVISGSLSYQSPHTGTITLESQLTGYGENFTGNLTYLTGDDDAFIITAITTDSGFTSFGDNQSSGAIIYDINANSGTRELIKNITFTGNRSGYIHFVDKAGNTGFFFIQMTGIQGAEVSVYAIPGYREDGNYSLTGTVSIYTISAGGTGSLYSTYTGTFSSTGLGQFTLDRPLYGQSIGVVLQSTMHLPSMGFTGTLTETGTNFFDFTLWTGRDLANLTSGWFDAVDLGAIGIRSLLVPGDVYKTDNVGTGSIINAFDMAEINANLTLDDTSKYPDYDFDNKEGIISSFEQAVIIQNLQRQGRDLDLDQFGGLVYTGF